MSQAGRGKAPSRRERAPHDAEAASVVVPADPAPAPTPRCWDRLVTRAVGVAVAEADAADEEPSMMAEMATGEGVTAGKERGSTRYKGARAEGTMVEGVGPAS